MMNSPPGHANLTVFFPVLHQREARRIPGQTLEKCLVVETRLPACLLELVHAGINELILSLSLSSDSYQI